MAAESINLAFIFPTIRLNQDLEVNINNLNSMKFEKYIIQFNYVLHSHNELLYIDLQ